MAQQILNQEILNLAQEWFDALLDVDTGLAKRHRLIYPPKKISCENCQTLPIGGRPGGIYRTGGPAPFPDGGVCPMCNGSNYKFVDVTEDVILKTEVESKAMRSLQVNVNMPDGILFVRGYMSDLPKIEKCDHLLHDLDTYGYTDRRYRLMRETISPSNIVKGRYFECYMERI